MKQLFYTLAILLLTTLGLQATTHSITVSDNLFTPNSLTITAGDTVVWSNPGAGSHNVNGTTATFPSNPASFGNGAVSATAWTYSFKFTATGVYSYHCDSHAASGMTGSITVNPAPSNKLVITAIYDANLPGGLPKGIELYALGDIADLSLYGLTSANNGGGLPTPPQEFTFPAQSATAGEYIYVASDSINFNSFFGFFPRFKHSVVNINGDDAIVLFFNGTAVDTYGEISVDGTGQAWEYTDGWAYRVSGTGPDGSTFVPASWTFNKAALPASVLTNASAASPLPIRTYTATAPTNPSVGFAAGTLSINEAAGTATVTLSITNPNTNATSVTVSLGAASTATSDDFSSTPILPTTVTFPANSTANQTITLNIVDDAISEATETIVLSLSDASNSATIGTGTMTISITDNDIIYPVRSIASLTTNNATGQPDSLNVNAEIKGIVYGINYRASQTGVQFTVIDKTDANAGIAIFNSAKTFNYTVTEGDEVTVRGKVVFFNGLTQIQADTLFKLTAGNALHTEATVTTIDEASESKLVILKNVKFTTPSQWPAANADANVTVSDGTNSFTLRIDRDTDIDGTTAPTSTATYDIVGIGGQFDSSSPYTEGYQLFPRKLADIRLVSTGTTVTYPVRSIGVLTTNNATTGQPDSLNVNAEIKGIVYGINYRASQTGVQFTIIDKTDANAGIAIFNSAKTFNYTVTEGDEVTVRGKVAFFNGLTQIQADTLFKLNSGNALHAAATVTALDETTESKLVVIKNVKFTTPSQWPATGTDANVTVSDGTNTFTLRIDRDTDIDGTTAPNATSNYEITGIGGQFDSATPYFEGYQLFPRSLADIRFATNTFDPKLSSQIKYFPNPASDYITLRTTISIDRVEIISPLGQLVQTMEKPQRDDTMNVSTLAKGLYFVRFHSKDVFWTGTFIKE